MTIRKVYDLIVERNKIQNDQIITMYLSLLLQKTERNAYYLFVGVDTSRFGMQIPSSLSHVASLGGARAFFFLMPGRFPCTI